MVSSSAAGFLDVCVVFVDHTFLCDHGGTYSALGPRWAAVATGVRDGTGFRLRVRAYDGDAQIVLFRLAF